MDTPKKEKDKLTKKKKKTQSRTIKIKMISMQHTMQRLAANSEKKKEFVAAKPWHWVVIA